MKKIPTALVRDPEDMSRVIPQFQEGCEWVGLGEGIATAKYDGTACMVRCVGPEKHLVLYKRREIRVGPRTKKEDTDFPMGWIEAGMSGWKYQGWVPISPTAAEDQYHREALTNTLEDGQVIPGTYELVGPKVQGNPHGYERHVLLRHGGTPLAADGAFSRTFYGFKGLLEVFSTFEGIVWHHPDGRMAKIKRRDFGLAWPNKQD